MEIDSSNNLICSLGDKKVSIYDVTDDILEKMTEQEYEVFFLFF